MNKDNQVPTDVQNRTLLPIQAFGFPSRSSRLRGLFFVLGAHGEDYEEEK
jgi:hypothetical protein